MIKIFRVIRKLFLIPSAVRWVKALDYASKFKYKMSLDYLNKVEKNMHKSPEYHALKGFVLLGCGDLDQSLKEMDLAKEQMAKSGKYSDADKQYMMAYISYCKGKAYSLKGEIELAKEVDDEINFDTLDLDKVKAALKMNFPLRRIMQERHVSQTTASTHN